MLPEDSSVRIWSLDQGEELVRLALFENNGWVVMTPEGYYNASNKGQDVLIVRHKNKVYGLNSFYDVFYRPDIVKAKLLGEDISGLTSITIFDALKNPPPDVEIENVPEKTKNKLIEVKYRVKSTGGGYWRGPYLPQWQVGYNPTVFYRTVKTPAPKLESRLAANGRALHDQLRQLVKDQEGYSPTAAPEKQDMVEGKVTIEAAPGENTVSLAAFNKNNTVQSRLDSVKFTADILQEPPHLFVLAVGVNQYSNPIITTLKFAVKDAEDLSNIVKKQAESLFKPENIHLNILRDNTATKRGILEALNEIAQKAKVGDSFVFFSAAHGLLIGNQYYLAPHDIDLESKMSTSISSNELVETSKKIKALGQLLIFDTCHSGGVDYIVSGLYDARMSVLAKKMGLHIYASASPRQQAIDGYQGNGLFSHVLLAGLNNNSDVDEDRDKAVSIVELGVYILKN